jgi:hypothetical protein
MTLKDYAKVIQKMVKDGHGDRIVIYAKDEEGNGYEEVYFHPSLGFYYSEGRGWGNFVNEEHADDYEALGALPAGEKQDAVCIN